MKRAFTYSVIGLASLLLATCSNEDPAALSAQKDQQKAEEPRPLKDVDEDSFSLKGIVEESSDVFACHIGSYSVRVTKVADNLKYLGISGKGILMNSGYLHTNVKEEEEITYAVAQTSDVETGSKISVFCLKPGGREQGEPAMIGYVVKEIAIK